MSKTVSPHRDAAVGPATPGDDPDPVLGQVSIDAVGQTPETRLQRQLRLACNVLIGQADALRELAKH